MPWMRILVLGVTRIAMNKFTVCDLRLRSRFASFVSFLDGAELSDRHHTNSTSFSLRRQRNPLSLPDRLHHFLRRIVHRIGRKEWKAAFRQCFLAGLDIVAFQTN